MPALQCQGAPGKLACSTERLERIGSIDDDAERARWFEPRWEELRRVQSVLDRFLLGVASPRVLDAGCGCPALLHFGEAPFIVGLDISHEQVRQNAMVGAGVVADLHTVVFRPKTFDVIVCFEVLEHLSEPEKGLRAMVDALKPGGLLTIGAPNVFSAKALVAKFTPHSVHEWTYRRLMHGPGHGHRERFRVMMRLAISPGRVTRFAAEQGLIREYFGTYEAPVQRAFKGRHLALRMGWRILRGTMRAASAGKVDNDATDYVVVLRRPLEGERRESLDDEPPPETGL